MGRFLIVVDTSVLINFLRIDRMDLLKSYDCQFLVTDHVSDEITDHYADQRLRLSKAISDGILRQETINRAEEMSVFSALSAAGILGSGECSAIALAVSNGYALALDDRRAANQVREISKRTVILRTQDLLDSMVSNGILSYRESESIKEIWARKHRFVIKDADDGLQGVLATKWAAWMR